jgi:GNAT superfamily N-acetyltransferase
MSKFLVRQARFRDAPQLEALLHEWLKWDTESGRIRSVRRSIKNREFLVAETRSRIVGFIHFVIHEDVIDGTPNSFITAFYVDSRHRRRGIGTKLLRKAVFDAAAAVQRKLGNFDNPFQSQRVLRTARLQTDLGRYRRGLPRAGCQEVSRGAMNPLRGNRYRCA